MPQQSRQKEEMVKGKAKIIGTSERSRSLRSRKRDEESEVTPLTVDIPSPVHQQDAEGDDAAMVDAPSQSAGINECSSETNQQDSTAEASSQSKLREDTTNEKHTGMSHTDTDVTLGTVSPANREETTAPDHDDDSQLGVPMDHSDVREKQKKELEEEAVVKGRCLHIVLPVLVEADGLCLTTLEKQGCATERSPRNLSDDMKTEPVKAPDNIKEPAKKKRRMGMCGLTEKERSQFFLVQKRDSGQNPGVLEKTEEKASCSPSADPLPMETSEDSPSSNQDVPADETLEGEKELQAVNGGENDSPETEVCVKASSETNAADECEEHIRLLLQQSRHPESEEHAENRSLPEQNTSPTGRKNNESDITTDKDDSKEEKEKEEEVSTSHNEESDKQEPVMAAALQVNPGEIAVEEESAPTANVQACEVVATPVVSEREEKSETEDEPFPGASLGNDDRKQRGNTTEPNGSVCTDDVSDSQLNTIDLIEDKMLEKSGKPDSSICQEDATNLICGLIKELSSLNQKLMATYRELENLRRSSKRSRSSRR